MNDSRNPLAAGLFALVRHRRLAAVLWLASLVALLPALASLARFARRWDEGPFRETILAGWDGWAVLSWLAFNPGEASTFQAAALVSVSLGAFLHLFLVPGLLRTIATDVNRPVLRRVVAESAALFRPNLWGFSRYLLTLAFWEGLLVALPVAAIAAAGKHVEAPPNGPLANLSLAWGVVVGTVVFLNVSARWSMARVALALDDSPTARGAYRVAKRRLSGGRLAAIGIALFWFALGLALQAGFTRAGVALNPSTGRGVLGLVLFRQAGFLLLAATRVGYWASLLAFERRRRPRPAAPAASRVEARA